MNYIGLLPLWLLVGKLKQSSQRALLGFTQDPRVGVGPRCCLLVHDEVELFGPEEHLRGHSCFLLSPGAVGRELGH